MTRVLILTSSAERRGAEVAAAGLAASLTARGHDAHVLALEPAADGAPSIDAETVPGGLGPDGLWHLYRRCRGAEVVIGYGGRTLTVGAVVTVGAPFVYRSIGDPLAWATSAARRLRVRLALARAARVVALWDGAAHTFVERLGVDEARTVVIPTGFDTDAFRSPTGTERSAARAALGLGEGVPCIAVVGALSEEKRVDLAIDAARRVEGAVLVVAGDGPLRTSLEARAAQHDGDVRFLGALGDVLPVLHGADVVLSTSRTEGLQGSLIEAGLCGVPAVAGAVGGAAAVVDEEGLVHLDSPEAVADPPAAVAASLRRVLAERDRLGAAARTRCVERFAVGPVVERWEAVLTEVVADRAALRPGP